MTMLLARRTPAGAPATRPRPAARPLDDRRSPVPTAALLRLADRADAALGLVPVGIAVHAFTETMAGHRTISAIDLHRATTVLTKQVTGLLTGDDRLRAVHRLVTDPDRPATPDGRSAAMLCGHVWPSVRSVADARATAAVEGAAAFGETAILRLAATRAALPTCRWWGTNGWLELVERWASDGSRPRRTVTALVRSPELVPDDILGSVLDR